MRLLITGASGMLGVDVQAAAGAAGHEVIALARAELDITDGCAVQEVLRTAAPDAVINCAAYTKVDEAEGDGHTAAVAVNTLGPGHLAAACAAVDAWLVHVSTDYVFRGDKTSGPYVESDETGPASVYGATKEAGERAIAEHAPTSHTIVRTAWLFGTDGPCFPATILRLAAERDQISVVDDQRGCPTFTPDLAQALVDLAERERRLLGVVHIAGGGECTWFEFARALVHEAGLNSAVTPCTTAEFPRPAPRPAYSVLRSERGDSVPVLRDWHESMSDYLRAREVAAR